MREGVTSYWLAYPQVPPELGCGFEDDVNESVQNSHARHRVKH
jgi:hypothetical protein